MSKSNKKLCLLALEKSSESSQKFRHGAIITKGKKPIVYGVNHSRCTINGNYSSCVHAEIDAIHKWLKIVLKGKKFNNKKERLKFLKMKGKKYKLYVVRENNSKNEIFSNSKPCNDCTQVLQICNIRIIYSYNNDVIISTKPNKLSDSIITSGNRSFPINIQKKKSINNNLVFGTY